MRYNDRQKGYLLILMGIAIILFSILFASYREPDIDENCFKYRGLRYYDILYGDSSNIRIKIYYNDNKNKSINNSIYDKRFYYSLPWTRGIMYFPSRKCKDISIPIKYPLSVGLLFIFLGIAKIILTKK